VQAFERAFAERLGLPNFTMLNSGSNSLHVAVHSLDLPADSEVILPAFTWVGCANAIRLCGCRPVFCDVELETQNVSARTIEPHLGADTRAIMVVHYAGLPVEMPSILAFGLPVVEDAAHAVDSRSSSVSCGASGAVGIYSFDAVKNLASPDGGGLTARDPALAERARRLRYCGTGKSGFEASQQRGRWWEYEVHEAFPRYIPNDVSAGIALGQLSKLDRLQARRREIWHTYQRELASVGWLCMPPDAPSQDRHSYFTYLVRVLDNRRDTLAAKLRANGIYTTLRYYPIHLTPYYRTGARLPNSERLAKEGLNLPLHPRLTDDEVDRVIRLVKSL
jgi:aminotransferase